jgi:exopolyphosphatase / guanosine-5'-triphosphate,3'-diphosphate pyrophosphatase
MINIKKPAVIDIGSNSVRLVIYEDFSVATNVFYNEKFSCKLGRFTSDGYLTTKSKENTIKALLRFKKICDANNVISIKAIATAAMRDAKDGSVFAKELSHITGFDIEIISGEQEAYHAAIGVGHKMPAAIGCVGDLGGGSLELSVLHKGIVGDTAISLPLGVLRLQNDLGDEFKRTEYTNHIETILSNIDFNTDFDSDFCNNFYCVGGSWRALISFYMQVHEIKLHILQGFCVRAEDLKKFIIEFLNNTINITDYDVSHISKRRISALPIAGLLLLKLIEKFNFKNIITSTAGLREGILLNILPCKRNYESSSLAFAISESELRSRNPLLYPHFIRVIKQILPDLPQRFLLLTEIIVYLSDVAYRRHTDYRAEYVFDFVLFSNLDDLTHTERVLVALSVAWRYNPDFIIPQNFASYIDDNINNLWYAKAIALILRYLYSITGISHLVASDLKFIRQDYSLEQLYVSDTQNVTLPEGETSQKRLSNLLKHLFD